MDARKVSCQLSGERKDEAKAILELPKAIETNDSSIRSHDKKEHSGIIKGPKEVKHIDQKLRSILKLATSAHEEKRSEQDIREKNNVKIGDTKSSTPKNEKSKKAKTKKEKNKGLFNVQKLVKEASSTCKVPPDTSSGTFAHGDGAYLPKTQPAKPLQIKVKIESKKRDKVAKKGKNPDELHRDSILSMSGLGPLEKASLEDFPIPLEEYDVYKLPPMNDLKKEEYHDPAVILPRERARDHDLNEDGPNEPFTVFKLKYEEPKWPHDEHLSSILSRQFHAKSLILDDSHLGTFRNMGTALVGIVSLSVQNCKLKSLDGAYAPTNLEVLMAAGNLVTSPTPLSACRKLRVLDLSKNPLKDVYEFQHLEECEKLQVLRVHDTPLLADGAHLLIPNLLPQLRECCPSEKTNDDYSDFPAILGFSEDEEEMKEIKMGDDGEVNQFIRKKMDGEGQVKEIPLTDSEG